jgi:DNA polymerase-3 subunit gamma/tau
LSRCQIFDFNRIRIADMTQHLGKIAQNEGITAEADALHIIAQKADGGLRDALSIFDQIVSFAGNNITYKSVIENLNILDYDYYFRITDAIIAGDIKKVLLTYDEILKNGFDGHLFINGLASHFRDLLVCKDQQTLVLLETSENIKDRYRTQAQSIAAPMLLQGLELFSKCDISYKAAKNQRLLVELTLMQACSLDDQGEKKNLS